MKNYALIFLMAMGLLVPVAAQAKTVPKEVLDWYKDTILIYSNLLKDLDRAADAPATAAAYQKAADAVGAKKLAPRYRTLKVQHPVFFDEEGGDATWAPPPEWLKVVEDYGAALETYGAGMQKAMAWYQDARVQKALEAFGNAMGEISPSE